MGKNRLLIAAVTGLMVIAFITGCVAAATPGAAALSPSQGGPAPVSVGVAQTTGGVLGNTITVIGSGSTQGEPDTGTAQIGIDTQNASLREATRLNNEQVTALVNALKAAGVADSDIQTAYYNVYTEQRYAPETGQSTGQVIYHANSSVSITIRDLSKVGAVLDAAVSAGANNISGVNFSIADPSKLEAVAREKAVADARARATDLARLFGVEVGDVVSISEVVTGSPILYERSATGMGGGGAPIQPGQLTVSSQLQVSFAIKK